MATVLTPPEQAAQKVILYNVSWETYERLLDERGENVRPLFNYDRGTLEIMVPSFEHENLKHDISVLIEALAEELEIDLVGAASTTFRKGALSRGFEPDASFYFRHAERVRGKTRIDLTEDPPPDLVIEIDITHPSLDKFPIFAGLGVPEVWRYKGKSLTIFKLEGGNYTEQASSAALPGVTGEGLTRLISESRRTKRTVWLRSIREWARTLRAEEK